MRFRLRTLLIVLAIGPALIAAGYWAWPRPSYQWDDIGRPIVLPPAKPGYHWKLTNDRGLIEAPIDDQDITMFRFTIRDLLWLMVVVAVVALLWRDRIAIKNERASLQQQVAAERAEIAAKRAAFNKDAAKMAELNRVLNASKRSQDREIEYRARLMARQYERPPTEDELEASKRRSAELGAPQPQPLPPGYGEKPN